MILIITWNLNNNADGALRKHEFEEGPWVQHDWALKFVAFISILAVTRFILF